MKYRIKKTRDGLWMVEKRRFFFMWWVPDYTWGSLSGTVAWIKDRGQKTVKVIM